MQPASNTELELHSSITRYVEEKSRGRSWEYRQISVTDFHVVKAAAEASAPRLFLPIVGPSPLWFEYFAAKSHYFLYSHSIFFHILILSLVPLPIVLLELARPAGFNCFKIQPKVWLSSKIFKCYKDVMKMLFLIVGPQQLLSYQSVKVRFRRMDGAWECMRAFESFSRNWICVD
ncbi:methylsterol monooxygenase 1-1-like [Eucalyptus grandis]|uniref:methylsterol monooxygenase 1-1-like n=1 Tax=Eucalyptus grandis TaxID=71139 RepID=UPI00192E8AF6|nr:methylsterol monooxygenase 1-1-like [Eucalyptus grandis]